jgi:thiol-disulfide isomerase/thioredoxin
MEDKNKKMKNNKIIMIVIGLLVIGGGVFMYQANTKKSVEYATTPVISENYKAYTQEELTFAENGKVVLFFKATWCPSCRSLDKNIKENIGSIPENVKILEVDYDTNPDLKTKYGVTTQHTLVQVDSSGELIKKWSGGSTLESVVTQIQ